MLPPISLLRRMAVEAIESRKRQGYAVEGLDTAFAALPDSFDAIATFARQLAELPMREDWPYREPDDLDAIWEECPDDRPTGAVGTISAQEASGRASAAFLASVCGCMLGKPLEVNPTLDEIRDAAEAVDAWPLDDYIPEALLERLGRRHGSWAETVRERIAFAAPDDDVNYTVLGMLLVERHGTGFTRDDVRRLWLDQLPVTMTFGPERLMLIRAAMRTLAPDDEPIDYGLWARYLNPKDEYCGALIRADAYGYACPGRPALAAELAWRDAGWTHRRTGVYGAMFVAAAIATAMVTDDRLGVFETALKFVPRRSRFREIVADSLEMVRGASDWLDGYRRIHGKYAEYSHCRVYQECGTLINSLRFAEDVADGFCKQVAQGNDTDSFGATAGSILGAYFGPGHLDERWLAPLGDDLRTTLARFYERRLSKVAERMGRLPGIVAKDLEADERE